MCGISGIISKNATITPQRLEAFNNITKHRGPDDEGYVLFNTTTQQLFSLFGVDTPLEVKNTSLLYQPTESIQTYKESFHIALGHRRLSILDLSPHGHLPMCDDNQRFWITYNGEVYNFIEIKEELISLGYTFKSSSDTEVILNAYIEWGEKCLNKMMGMFAIAIFDKQKEEIFLARDRFGIKPLYYYTDQNQNFYFGSEIKQFNTSPTWQAILNKQKAYDYLFYNLTDHSDETMFEGVYHLPPGCYYKSTLTNFSFSGKLPVINWYQIPKIKTNLSFEAATNQFKDMFKNAVKMHLRSDVTVGSALSGGLDSSAIVCQINELLTAQNKADIQKTFSSVANDERFSEKKWMDEVINFTKVDAHFVYPSGANLFELTPKILWHMDEPYNSQSAYLGYHVFKNAAQNGVKVLLNGQGADEYLSGYTDYRSLRWKLLFQKFQLATLSDELKENGFSSITSRVGHLFKIGLSLLVPDKWTTNYLSTLKSDYQQIKNLVNLEKLAEGKKLTHPLANLNADNNSVYNISNKQLFYTSLPKYLRWEDRNSMAHAVEARVPFLDHRLVEFTLSLPVNYLDSKTETKKLLINGLKNLLPKAILNRKDKKGFITPEEIWVKHEYTQQIRAQLAQSIKHSQGIIKPEALTYFDDVVAGKKPFNYNYWRMILFGMWMNLYNVKIKA